MQTLYSAVSDSHMREAQSSRRKLRLCGISLI